MVNQFQSKTTLIVRDSFNEARSMRIKAKLFSRGNYHTKRETIDWSAFNKFTDTETRKMCPQQCVTRMAKIESKQTEHACRRTEFSVKVKLSGLVKTSTNNAWKNVCLCTELRFSWRNRLLSSDYLHNERLYLQATDKSRPNLHCSWYKMCNS